MRVKGRTNNWILFLNAVALATAIGCAAKSAPPAKVTQTPTAPVAPAATPPQQVQLADGPGRRILTTVCTACHALTEVTKFNGFYTRPQWRDIVLTMMDYGAPIGSKEVELLADYLTEQLGKKQ
jgi:cytochrome c5